MRVALALAFLLFSAPLVSDAGPKQHTAPSPASLTASGWQTETTFRKFSLTNDAGGDLTFIFPDEADGAFGYLYSKVAYNMSGLGVYSATFSIVVVSGAPTFHFPPQGPGCDDRPGTQVRLFLWGTQSRWWKFSRWWSHAAVQELEPGVFTITANLNDLADWSSVYGDYANASQNAADGFADTKASGQIGLTFGGGCFFGHGVGTEDGIARFELHQIEAH